MDQHLELALNWLKSLFIENIDIDKLKRQLSVISEWFKVNGKGCFLAVTGFGKTLVGIIIIYRLNIKYSQESIFIVVPSLKLYADWNEHILTYGLTNCHVFVINTFINLYERRGTKWNCGLLIIDEVHNVLSEEAIKFNQTIDCINFKMFLGLSATLDEDEREILYRKGLPIFDEVTMSEARRFGYISDYTIFNYGINLEGEDQEAYKRLNDIHNSNFSKFRYFVDSNKNWDLIRACTAGNNVNMKVGDEWRTGKEWREWYANKMDWDGTPEHKWSPTNISKAAHQWNWAMSERRKFLYKHPSKILVAKEIIERYDTPTIVFSESTDFADELTEVLGEKAKSYHSNIESTIEYRDKEEIRKTLKGAKLLRQRTGGELIPVNIGPNKVEYHIKYKKEIRVSGKATSLISIREFEEGKISVLVTAKALDEGLDIEGINCAIICSATSRRRQSIQRMGRALRKVEGKTAKIFNIYVKETQDETWLKKRQRGEVNVRWINSLEQIENNQSVEL